MYQRVCGYSTPGLEALLSGYFEIDEKPKKETILSMLGQGMEKTNQWLARGSENNQEHTKQQDYDPPRTNLSETRSGVFSGLGRPIQLRKRTLLHTQRRLGTLRE